MEPKRILRKTRQNSDLEAKKLITSLFYQVAQKAGVKKNKHFSFFAFLQEKRKYENQGK